MVDSPGVRRRISRRTVRPPTPESKTPIGRESVTGEGYRHVGDRAPVWIVGSLARSREGRPARGRCRAQQGPGDLDDVLADAGVRLGGHERRALVARRADDLALGADLELRLAAEGLAQVGRVDARGRVGAIHEV